MDENKNTRVRKRVFKRTATPTFSPLTSEDRDRISVLNNHKDQRFVNKEQRRLSKSPEDVYEFQSPGSPVRKAIRKRTFKRHIPKEITYNYRGVYADISPDRFNNQYDQNETFEIISKSHRRVSADQTIDSVNGTFTQLNVPCSSFIDNLKERGEEYKENLPCVDSEKLRGDFSNVFVKESLASKISKKDGKENVLQMTISSEVNLIDPISKKLKGRRISLRKDILENHPVNELNRDPGSSDKKSKKLPESINNDSDADIQFHIRQNVRKIDINDVKDNLYDKVTKSDCNKVIKSAKQKYGQAYQENYLDNKADEIGNSISNSSDEETELQKKDSHGDITNLIKCNDSESDGEDLEVFQERQAAVKSKSRREIRKSTAKTVIDQAKYHSFILSLSEEVDESEKKRHPEAIRYVKDFQKNKNELAKTLFQEFNNKIFDGKLPVTMDIRWNKRLSTTAGYCKYTINRTTNAHKACIELSDKVCDSSHRLRDILLHEMCHAAVWILNKRKESHGPNWKGWADLSSLVYPEIPRVDVAHNYAIVKKFLYICMNCNYHISRHSKSIDENAPCKKCGVGDLKLERNPAYSSIRKQRAREPSSGLQPFALFLKENYRTVRQQRGSHSDTMKALSEKFKKSKLSIS
ncbi:DgyrCDS8067 [Dimorphilus gyrociliatus]|uniref:DgyrCDS8067 n=1 Tax=Dimorphilus gyrociliatus TaxID=2664684 RepID=A0A7I8VT29_9ANNE|nr:DgyrCDS8067 [Dimorphilus gyrociliatus]